MLSKSVVQIPPFKSFNRTFQHLNLWALLASINLAWESMGIIVLLHFLTHVLIRIAWDSLPACEWTKQMRRDRGLPNLPPGSASVPPLLNRMLTRTELWCVNMCFVRFRHLPNIQARRVKLKFLQSWRLFFVKKNCSRTVLFARGRPIWIIQITCEKNCQICTKLAEQFCRRDSKRMPMMPTQSKPHQCK